MNPMTGANEAPSEAPKTEDEEEPHLRHPYEKRPAQMCPVETSINSGDSGGSDLRHSTDLFSPDDQVSDADSRGEL
jgi:hypothetical protein